MPATAAKAAAAFDLNAAETRAARAYCLRSVSHFLLTVADAATHARHYLCGLGDIRGALETFLCLDHIRYKIFDLALMRHKSVDQTAY